MLQNTVGDVDFASEAAIWRIRPNDVVWRPTGVATWRTGRNIRVVLDSGIFGPLCETLSTKPEVHNIALPSAEGRATATIEVYSKFGEIKTCGFWDTQADRQTMVLYGMVL